jgi:hypothetical protein
MFLSLLEVAADLLVVAVLEELDKFKIYLYAETYPQLSVVVEHILHRAVIQTSLLEE